MKNSTSSIYQLESENLTSLGRMGDTSTTNWIKLFSTLEYATAHAEADYKKYFWAEEIKWTKDRSGGCGSQDLNWVMYNIRLVRLTK